jgi:hypothetical protein
MLDVGGSKNDSALLHYANFWYQISNPIVI